MKRYIAEDKYGLIIHQRALEKYVMYLILSIFLPLLHLHQSQG